MIINIIWKNFDKHHDHYNLKAQEAGKVKLCCMTITTGPGTAFTNFEVIFIYGVDDDDEEDEDDGGDINATGPDTAFTNFEVILL